MPAAGGHAGRRVRSVGPMLLPALPPSRRTSRLIFLHFQGSRRPAGQQVRAALIYAPETVRFGICRISSWACVVRSYGQRIGALRRGRHLQRTRAAHVPRRMPTRRRPASGARTSLTGSSRCPRAFPARRDAPRGRPGRAATPVPAVVWRRRLERQPWSPSQTRTPEATTRPRRKYAKLSYGRTAHRVVPAR